MGKSKKQQKLSNLECASFCSQMTMVLHAGFPAVEGVSLLLEDAKDVQEKAILQVMYDEMINTGRLSGTGKDRCISGLSASDG